MEIKLFSFRIYSLIIILLTCSLLVQLQAQCTNIHPGDLAALQALYQSTDGDHWTDNTGWYQIMNSTTPTVCDLENIYGLTFDRDRVVRIGLVGNNLIGSIPTELANLTLLQGLHLANNQLSGQIPPPLGNLASFRYLNLSSNILSGPIPPELGNSQSLIYLILFDNELTGSIPSTLGQLPNVRHLNLSRNRLTGTIPVDLGNLSIDGLLNLSHNRLTGPIPIELGNLTSLTGLLIGYNRLDGQIPPELGNMTSLQVLSLQENRLIGHLPQELGNLSPTNLWLQNNNLNGCYHPNLRNLCDAFVLLDDAEFNVPWADFCAGHDGGCNPEPCADTLHYFPQLCELPKQKIIDFALAASDCPIVEYTLSSQEGLPLPDTLYGDQYEFCKPVLFSYKCQDGRTCEMYILLSSEFTAQEFVSMAMQEYLSGTTFYNVRGCPGTYTYEDEEQYHHCELTRIKRYWRYADFCGSYESGVQYIDIRDFFFCRFAGPFRLPEGIESWIRLDLPDKINLKGIKFHWSVKGLDWKILDQKGSALLVLPGKDIVKVGVEIDFPTGLTLDVYGKFESYKSGFDKSKKRSQSTASITAEEIEVFTNPAPAQITIRCPAHQTGQQVQIINQWGVVVGENKIQGHEMNMSISDLSPGIYSLQVSDGTSFAVKRFVKM